MTRSPSDAGFAVIDAVIGATLAALLALAVTGGVRQISAAVTRIEAEQTAWTWAQALVETGDSNTVTGTTDDGDFRWSIVRQPDEHDATIETITATVISNDGSISASIATRRVRQSRLHID